MPNNAGGRFQITSACGLQTGPTPYTTAGPYTVTVAFSGASASANPYNLSFSVTVNSSGGVTKVQSRLVSNFGATTTPAGFWLPLGQPFAEGQIPAGDGVIWKTGGGTTIASQGDDCSHWPDGSVRFCSFTLLFPTALAPLAQDNGVGAYDNPGGGFNNTCFSGSPTTLITNKDIRLEATTSAATVTATLGATYKATGSGVNFTTTGVSGVIHPGDPIAGTGVPSSTTIVSQTSGTTGGAGVYVTSNATTSSGATITETGHMDVASVVSGTLASGQVLWGPRVAVPQTITGGGGTSWTVSPGAVYASGQVAAGVGTTWTLSANNEFANEASTHTIMYRSGPEECSYAITGQLRNGTTFASSPQGQIFGVLYIDVRVDGTYRVEGNLFQCQPMATSTTQTATCNSVGLAPDANGDMYAIKDYSLTGAARQLMGCAFAVNPWVTPACITSGHATAGLGTVIYYGSKFVTASPDGFPYDSQTDAHMVIPAFPLFVSSDPTTRGLYDADLTPNIGYTGTVTNGAVSGGELAAIAGSTLVEGNYGPNVCPFNGLVRCSFGTSGEQSFIGVISVDASQCMLAGQITTSGTGWRVCNNSRMEALEQGNIQANWRDELTGRDINLSSFYTPPTGTMNTFTTGGFGNPIASGQIKTNVGAYLANQWENNHAPNFANFQYILTGERSFGDAMRDNANADIAIQNHAPRNPTINGNAYSAIIQQVPQIRLMAWEDRDVSNAYWLTPDFLADGVTANPEKGYYAAIFTGAHGSLAYFNDLNTAPYMISSGTTSNQATLGIIQPLGPNAGGFLGEYPVATHWQAGYWSNVLYQDAARGLFNSTNCHNGATGNPATFTTAVASCNIFAVYLHRFYLGSGVNGCINYAAVAYSLSATIASRPYAFDNTGIVAQSWSDVYSGDTDSNVVGPGLAKQPPSQTTGGNTIELTYASAPSPPPTVGMNINFGVTATHTQSGITIPAETIITSVSQDTSGTCATGFCYIIGFGPSPMSGGAIPATLSFYFDSWGGNGNPIGPIIPFPLIPPAGPDQCPSEGFTSNNGIVTNGSVNPHALYFYDAAVGADQQGDSYGTTLRRYFENFTGSPTPGGVKPGGNTTGPYSTAGYSPECAGSFATWDNNKAWPNDAVWAQSPQWNVQPVGAPLTDSAGRPTGCH